MSRQVTARHTMRALLFMMFAICAGQRIRGAHREKPAPPCATLAGQGARVSLSRARRARSIEDLEVVTPRIRIVGSEIISSSIGGTLACVQGCCRGHEGEQQTTAVTAALGSTDGASPLQYQHEVAGLVG
jgi:hypothetical protein